MKRNILVIAPHADDETLGCGGTICRHIENGDRVSWIIVTNLKEEYGYTSNQVNKRNKEIEVVSKLYGFDQVKILGLPPAKLDTIPMGNLVQSMGMLIKKLSPEIIYLPYPGDIHTDHKVVFDVTASCSKWFRYNSVKRVLAYETLSETEFGISPDNNGFRPNVFVNIEGFLDKKIEIMNTFVGEVAEFPFPRSDQAIKALAMLRGSAAGCQAAEAFMLIKEIQ